MKAFTCLIFLAWAVASCNPLGNNFIASNKTEEAKKIKDTDDEKVDVPNNIAGSYLSCALRKDATATDLNSEYGCRLNDASTNTKLDLSAYTAQVRWLSNAVDGIRIESYPVNSVWHALYRVTANDLATLRERAAGLQIQVQYQTAPLKAARMVEVLQTAEAAGDTGAPVLQGKGLDPTDPGTL